MKISWFAMATPESAFVPTWPIMRLSSRLTKLEMPFCTIIGMAINISLFIYCLS